MSHDDAFEAEFRLLPLRPRPVHDELPAGYMARLSERLGTESPRALWAAIASRYGAGPNVLQQCLGLSEIEWQHLKGPWLRYCKEVDLLPVGLSRADFTLEVMRWCPQCLSESMHLRFQWSIKLVCWCDVHRVRLLDACPGCGTVQRLERSRLSSCSCGYHLAHGSAEPGSDVLAYVQGCLNDSLQRGLSDVGFGLSANDWIELLRVAEQIIDAQRSRATGQVAGLDRVEKSARQSQALGQLLRDWPHGFHSLLAQHQAEKGTSLSISKTYGRIYKWLYAYLEAPCFQFLRDAFEAYLNEHWWGLICRRNRNLRNGTKASHGRSTVSASATAAGTGPSTVKQLHLAGLVAADVVELPSGRSAWSVPVSEIATIAGYVEDAVDLQTAARTLGVAKSRVRELVDARKLTAHIRSNGGSRPWMLSRMEVCELLERCRMQIRSQEDAGNQTVSIHQILKCWRLQEGEFAKLMTAVQSGVVRAHGFDACRSGLSGFLIERDAAMAWRTSIVQQCRDWLSIDAAARMLGVKQQVGYQLVRSGLLLAEGNAGLSGKRVHRDEVRRFGETYISLSAVAAAVKRSPKALLPQLGVRPVCGPSVDDVRQYFFRRRDLTSSGVQVAPVGASPS